MSTKTDHYNLLSSFSAFKKLTLKFLAGQNVFLCLCLGLSVGTNFYQAQKPETRISPIGVKPDGTVMELVSLDEGIQGVEEIKRWYTKTMINCMTLGPNDFKLRTEQCRESFTADGFDLWLKELKRSHFDELINVGLNISEITPTGPTIIREQQNFNGSLGYILEFPAKITFSVGHEYRSYKWVISGLILRVEQKVNWRGIALQQIKIDQM